SGTPPATLAQRRLDYLYQNHTEIIHSERLDGSNIDRDERQGLRIFTVSTAQGRVDQYTFDHPQGQQQWRMIRAHEGAFRDPINPRALVFQTDMSRVTGYVGQSADQQQWRIDSSNQTRTGQAARGQLRLENHDFNAVTGRASARDSDGTRVRQTDGWV